MNNKIQITMVAIIIASLAFGSVGSSAFATKGAYQSGFDHGCSDAGISNPNNWYINGVNSKGESTGKDHHTDEFNNGYDAGFNQCGGNNNQATTIISDVNTNLRKNTQNQAAETNQGATCHTLIGNCNIGQASSNEFAAANDQ